MRRSVALLVALVVAATGLGVASGAPHRQVANADQTVLVNLLAGSPRYLVYALGETQRIGGQLRPTNSEYLWVRKKNGKRLELGQLPAGVQPWTASVAGSIFAIFAPPHRVYWWRIGSEGHGKIRINKSWKFLTAVPDGALVRESGGIVYDVPTEGAQQEFPTIADAKKACVSAATDGTTVVMTGCPPAPGPVINPVLGPSTRPSPYTEIAGFGYRPPYILHQMSAGTVSELRCVTVVNGLAGCFWDGDIAGGHDTVALIPTSGHEASVVQPSALPTTTVGIAGNTLIWTGGHGLVSMRYGSAILSYGSPGLDVYPALSIPANDRYAALHRAPLQTVSAYGAVATVTRSQRHVDLATSAITHSRLFTVPRHNH